MSETEATPLEIALADLIRPLLRRIEALEHALATERRIAALEARAGIERPASGI